MPRCRRLCRPILARLLFAWGLLLVPLAHADTPKRLVAVLEFVNEAGLTPFEVQALSDDVRGAALMLPQDRYGVMTRENMMMLLPPGTDLAQCSGAQCEVDAGRKVGADLVVSGAIGRFADDLEVRLKLFDTRTARLLAQQQAQGAGLKGLRAVMQDRAVRLFQQGLAEPGMSGESGAVPPGVRTSPTPAGGLPPAPQRVERLGTLRPEVGFLRIEGEPAGARLEISGPESFGDGGRLVVQLPYGPAEVPSGDYRVDVSAAGRDDRSQQVFVGADRTEVVRLELPLSEGTLEITGSPEGARVELSCAKEFTRVFGLPGTLTVPRGSCRVRVSRSGYLAHDRAVQVEGGATARVEVRLQDTVAAPSRPSARKPAGGSRDRDAWLPHVDRPVGLLHGHAEAGMGLSLGLSQGMEGKAGRMIIGGAYGVHGFEFGATLEPVEWFLRRAPVPDGTTLKDEILTDFGGATVSATWAGARWIGTRLALDIPGHDVSTTGVSLSLGVPFSYPVLRNWLALQADLGLGLGFGDRKAHGDEPVQVWLTWNYGIAVNLGQPVYLAISNPGGKRFLPDTDPWLSLAFELGWSVIPELDIVAAFRLNSLYPRKDAESRTLLFGLTYHHGWRRQAR